MWDCFANRNSESRCESRVALFPLWELEKVQSYIISLLESNCVTSGKDLMCSNGLENSWDILEYSCCRELPRIPRIKNKIISLSVIPEDFQLVSFLSLFPEAVLRNVGKMKLRGNYWFWTYTNLYPAPLPASSLVTPVLLSPQCEQQSVWGGQKRLHRSCEIQRAAHSPLFVARMRAISPLEQATRERMAIRDARARRFPTSPRGLVADSRVLSWLASLSKTKWRYIFVQLIHQRFD